MIAQNSISLRGDKRACKWPVIVLPIKSPVYRKTTVWTRADAIALSIIFDIFSSDLFAIYATA